MFELKKRLQLENNLFCKQAFQQRHSQTRFVIDIFLAAKGLWLSKDGLTVLSLDKLRLLDTKRNANLQGQTALFHYALVKLYIQCRNKCPLCHIQTIKALNSVYFCFFVASLRSYQIWKMCTNCILFLTFTASQILVALFYGQISVGFW